MSKELEALKQVKNFLGYNYCSVDLPNELRTIEQALQRLEAIDNANPSEALNYLDQFINEMTKCLENPKQYVKDYDKEIFYKYKYTFETTIKQALLKAQEQEKVLEIIKNKEVDVKLFFNALFREQQYKINPLEFYNGTVGYKRLWLTQEEFDILKRWLE